MDDVKVVFATNIKRLRKEKGLTQDALALRLGVAKQSIQNWEVGRRWPTIDLIDKIAVSLNVTTSTLFQEQPTPTVTELAELIASQQKQISEFKGIPQTLMDKLKVASNSALTQVEKLLDTWANNNNHKREKNSKSS